MMEEQAFIDQLNRKQPEAFRMLFCNYGRSLILYALGYHVDQDVAEDIVQEVFINLYEGKMFFSSPGYLRAFLYTSVRNSVLNYLKHKKIEQYYLRQTELEEIEEEKEEIELKILKEEVYRRIFAILETLPAQCRRIFEMHLEGHGNEEIANLLHLSIHTVKTQKKRVMQKLRLQLGHLYMWYLIFWP